MFHSFIQYLEIKINGFKIIESPNMNSTSFIKVKRPISMSTYNTSSDSVFKSTKSGDILIPTLQVKLGRLKGAGVITIRGKLRTEN